MWCYSYFGYDLSWNHFAPASGVLFSLYCALLSWSGGGLGFELCLMSFNFSLVWCRFRLSFCFLGDLSCSMTWEWHDISSFESSSLPCELFDPLRRASLRRAVSYWMDCCILMKHCLNSLPLLSASCLIPLMLAVVSCRSSSTFWEESWQNCIVVISRFSRSSKRMLTFLNSVWCSLMASFCFLMASSISLNFSYVVSNERVRW